MKISLVSFVLSCLVTAVQSAPEPVESRRTATFTLWQLPEQTRSQMMSYVILTTGGRIVVIDGGMSGDAPYLKEFLASLGNHVHYWFITHPHPDHVDALTEILRDPGELKIEKVYGSLPDEEWVKTMSPTGLGSLQAFHNSLRERGKHCAELLLGTEFWIDSMKVEVLGVKNPEIHGNALNNSSLVLRMSDKGKSVLFLGDLGIEGGKKLLAGKYGGRLKSDYVQMAHHGQNGVGEDVYKAIGASYCLWPTPIWLWDNDKGKGKGSGPWRTLEVREWMEKMNIKRHYVTALDGLSKID